MDEIEKVIERHEQQLKVLERDMSEMKRAEN